MKLSKIKIKEEMDKNNIPNFIALAKSIGVTKQQLSTMLSDNYNPIKSNVMNLCNSLKTNPESIMEMSDNKTESDMPMIDYENEITALELFAGAGGLALGLEQAGIKSVSYIEFDKACCETLKKNRPEWNVINDDIHNVDFSKYENKVDIVTGGFPCQAFSFAGKKLGFEDTRGTLFHEFARCIKETKPKMFMAENVRGLVSHDKGKTLQTIIEVLESLGYKTQQKVLNAAYFGVGQKRERIIIVGIRNDLNLEFSYPTPNNCMTTLKEALKDCPSSRGVQYSENKRKVLDLIPPGGCWIDLPEEIAKEYMGNSYYSGGGKRGIARRISWDEPCLTLTCSPSQKQTERCHPDETRPFTVRESARIQSFPDDWEFCGSLSDQYKQIGNAVPVELARRLGIELKKAIESLKN